MTTFDFEDGNGPVPARQHHNGGGWVANTAKVSPTAYVGPNALVYGNARVYNNARVYGDARIYGNAEVSGKTMISGNARVSANARIYGNARVTDNARVSGYASVSDNARVYNNARVYDNARVYGNAFVYGNARVYGYAVIKDSNFPQIKRSDGYDFIAVPCSDGKTRVIAGCRYFTFEEAETHWKETRGGTPLGDETMLILKFLKKYVKMQDEQHVV